MKEKQKPFLKRNLPENNIESSEEWRRAIKSRWIRHTDKVFQRSFESFLGFPDVVSDENGIIANWIECVKIEPLWAKLWHCKPGWAIGRRVVNDSFWYWFKNDCGWATIGNSCQRHHFQAGDILLIPRGLPHAIQPLSKRISTVITVHFQAVLYSDVNILSLMGFPYVVHGAHDAPFESDSHGVAREFALKSLGWKQSMRDRIMNVLLYIIRNHGQYFRRLGEGRVNKYLPRLLPVLEWLEPHLHEPELTIHELARRGGVSEVYLRIMFREALRISPAAYICRCRIQRACSLLRLTQLNIKEISVRTGFNSEAFFSRIFCKLMDVTPSQYRADSISGKIQM